MNIFDYFFEQKRESDKLFVLGNRESVSYREIFENTIALAHWLYQKYGEGNHILLVSENSVFFIVAYLAIMKSGNICVPISPAMEEVNLKYVVRTTQATLALADSRSASRLKIPTMTVFDERHIQERVLSNGKRSEFKSSAEFDASRPAQVLFTSGSTGVPKGVILSHKNLMANTQSIVEYLGLTDRDIVEVVLPFYYCYGLSLLHTHLKAGGAVVLNNQFVFLGSVFKDLQRYGCTGFSGVPSHFQILLRKSNSFKSLHFPQLRYVTQAGGKLHNTFITEFTEAFPHVRFFVMYGQTEATARLSYLPPDMLSSKLGSIGRGIPGVQLDIHDEHGHSVAAGSVGEIVARGDNIMLGYLNDPESNARTIRNGWLYTGDIGKRDPDGFIYLLARKKEIIKVGGKRVSPKEIEEVIVSIPSVIDCHVEGTPDRLQGEAIKAVVVLKNGQDREAAREMVLRGCAEKLARFKIPRYIEFEEHMQISTTGKRIKKDNLRDHSDG